MNSKWFWIVGAMFLFLKISLALLGPQMVTTDNTGDALWYLDRAAIVAQTGSVLDQDGLKTALYPVGYPYFLGVVFAVFGSSLRTAVLLNSLLSLAGAALVYLLAKLLFNRKVAIAAALVMLIAPAQYIYSYQVFSEHLFTILLLLVLLSTLFVVRRHLLIALLTGSLIALACLTRGNLVLLVPVLVLGG